MIRNGTDVEKAPNERKIQYPCEGCCRKTKARVISSKLPVLGQLLQVPTMTSETQLAKHLAHFFVMKKKKKASSPEDWECLVI